MYDSILLPTDGSEAAAAARTSAIGLARRFGASIHALYVLEATETEGAVDPEGTADLGAFGSNVLETATEQAAAAGVDITTETREPDERPHQTIVDCALDRGADLIVMGTTGRTGIHRLVIGSVAERTVRISPVPVLTVHAAAPLADELTSVLVPTDGSAPADAAAEHAIDLAATTTATLHVVHAVEAPPVPGNVARAPVTDALETAGQDAVDELGALAAERGVTDIRTAILAGSPARSIVEYVDEHGIDLIVMGTHGRTGIDRYILGSVTGKVVRLSTIPVLTISMFEE